MGTTDWHGGAAVAVLGCSLCCLAPGGPASGLAPGLSWPPCVCLGVIAGGLVGLLFAVFLVGFMLYRMKKKDEGSYSLEEPKQANGGAYQKPTKQEEFYA